jgi:hypothetical protein
MQLERMSKVLASNVSNTGGPLAELLHCQHIELAHPYCCGRAGAKLTLVHRWNRIGLIRSNYG